MARLGECDGETRELLGRQGIREQYFAFRCVIYEIQILKNKMQSNSLFGSYSVKFMFLNTFKNMNVFTVFFRFPVC